MEQVKRKFRRLLFLHRVAFICNMLFLVCLLIRYTNADAVIPQPLVELAALLGWIFSPVINLICLLVSFVLVLKRRNGLNIPFWLLLLNTAFFIFELLYFFLS